MARAFNSSLQTFTAEAVELTRFEKLAAEHGILEQDWERSRVLRAFAEAYACEYYVPEYLLAAWGLAERTWTRRGKLDPEAWLAQYRKRQSQYINQPSPVRT